MTDTNTTPVSLRSKAARDLLLVTLVAAALFMAGLGARDLWAPNEPIYGRAVMEMAESGSWLVPTVNGQVFAEKPALYFWLARLTSALPGGVDEFNLRLPSALAGVLSALLTYGLVLFYMNHRRALIAAILFVTMYQVFWAARTVQMDILVLASTLGTLLPLVRMLDGHARIARAWGIAGLAAGLGFAAKGPVALVIPALVLVTYCACSRRLGALLDRRALIGAAVALAAGAPWYVALWLGNENLMLQEVLIRQNFHRFVEAWDHQQPWWYYLKYLLIDYAPWVLLLPAAWLAGSRTDNERKLHLLAWIWILTVILFFSLSDSKRAPYILPLAPAVAVLAASAVDRWMVPGSMGTAARRAFLTALGVCAAAFGGAGIAALAGMADLPAGLLPVTTGLGLLLCLIGAIIAAGVVFSRRTAVLAPSALAGGMAALCLAAALWALPAMDPFKSSRGFAEVLNDQLSFREGEVSSYRLGKWRAGYSYYAGRTIPNIDDRGALQEFWNDGNDNLVLVEWRGEEPPNEMPEDAIPLHRQTIGGRTAVLYRHAEHPASTAQSGAATAASSGGTSGAHPAASRLSAR